MRLVLLSLVGLVLFGWPFLGGSMTADVPAFAIALGSLGSLLVVELGARRLDARGIALLAAIAALDAGLRLTLVTGIGGFSPVFFLILCAGYAFGPAFGFEAGAVALVVSAIATGGVGPWLPYQVFGAGWVGVAAGVAGGLVARLRRAPSSSSVVGGRVAPTRRDILVLAAVGLVAGFAYGALMDAWDWTFFAGSPDLGWIPGLPLTETVARFVRLYLVTSLAYDSFRAIGNALLVLALGAPILAALGRLRRRMTFEVVAPGDLIAPRVTPKWGVLAGQGTSAAPDVPGAPDDLVA